MRNTILRHDMLSQARRFFAYCQDNAPTAAMGALPIRPQPTDKVPHKAAWSRGPPSGLQRDLPPRQKSLNPPSSEIERRWH